MLLLGEREHLVDLVEGGPEGARVVQSRYNSKMAGTPVPRVWTPTLAPALKSVSVVANHVEAALPVAGCAQQKNNAPAVKA